jgi:signal transduction histidine kinase
VLLSSDGHEIPVSQVLIAHPSAQGGVWFISTIMRDISEWKRLDEMKSEFVSTVSHELRTPLTSIRGSLGLLEAGVAGVLPAQAHDLIHIARGNTERLIRLINEMLDLDKIEAGKLELHPQPLTPAELVQTAVDEIRPLADLFRVQVDQRVEAHRTFEGDRDRVLQVLLNLLSNAVKFSPAGSVITISALPATGEFDSEAGGHIAGRAPVRFVVENPGPGIASRDIVRLFTRFQQLDGSDGRRRGGTGLGLAISKAIVEQHGGQIGVESDPGRTTRFWFELPAVLPGPVSSPD